MALSYIDDLRSRSWVGFAEVAILAPELLIMRRRERSPARTLQECLFKVWLGTGVIMSVMSLAIPEHMADVLDEWGAVSLILEKIILGHLGEHHHSSIALPTSGLDLRRCHSEP